MKIKTKRKNQNIKFFREQSSALAVISFVPTAHNER